MHPRARIIIPLVLVAVLIGGGYWLLQESAQARNGTLTGTGTIEAEEVLVTAEIAGRVQHLFVDEGSEVRIGEDLAQIDTALLEAQLEQRRRRLQQPRQTWRRSAPEPAARRLPSLKRSQTGEAAAKGRSSV
jgi:Multidrug resistance efflux pump